MRTTSTSLAPATSAMAATLFSALRTWSEKSGGTASVAGIQWHLFPNEVRPPETTP